MVIGRKLSRNWKFQLLETEAFCESCESLSESVTGGDRRCSGKASMACCQNTNNRVITKAWLIKMLICQQKRPTIQLLQARDTINCRKTKRNNSTNWLAQKSMEIHAGSLANSNWLISSTTKYAPHQLATPSLYWAHPSGFWCFEYCHQ